MEAEPDEVTAFGKGNNEVGAKKLDKMSADIMKQKGMKKFPPKSKPLSSYMNRPF